MRVLVLIAASCVVVAGCAAPGQLVLADPAVTTTSFRFTDDRTRLSRAGTVESGRASYGDGNLRPAPPELVASWLQGVLATELRGKHVVLSNFDFGARGTYVSNPGVAPGAGAIHSLMTPTLVFLRIDGKVDDRPFAVAVNDSAVGPANEERLKAVLSQARSELVREVRRAAAGT
jgi:hypothetical protein